MNMYIKNPALLSVLIACLGSVLVGHLPAQTFTTLYRFTAGVYPNPSDAGMYINSDGAFPNSSLVLSGNTLYGTAEKGCPYGFGTVFAISTAGTGFTNLHNFTGGNDGANPWAGLSLSSNTLYGTAEYSGSWGNGTVFALNTDGTGFTNLHSFTGTYYSGHLTNSDGANPCAGLILSSNTLYGTALRGGGSFTSGAYGTVFKLSTDGTGFTTLHKFSLVDGDAPYADLILSGNTLYGTAYIGGEGGTVFKVNTDGTGFAVLHFFSPRSTNSSGVYTNSDGAGPKAGLLLSGNTLYGTAEGGGTNGSGTVFAMNTDGTGFTILYNFTAASGYSPATNSDGANPDASLVLSGNTLYGTAYRGGSSGNGTVFALNTDGTGFTNLHSFSAGGSEYISGTWTFTNSDGANPDAGLILSGNTLYGTTSYGGSSGNGTIFSISFTPQLTITPAGTNVVLAWATNFAGFDYTGYTLHSTTSLASSAIWTTNLPAPVVVNGQNTVTNPISGTQQFYRLSQ